MKNIIPRLFNNSIIQQRSEDGYINLNQMAEATGKRIDNWNRLKETKELIAEFDRRQKVDTSDLRGQKRALITTKGTAKDGTRGGGGTWAHPDIAIQFAQKCSPAFALQVSQWIREWMTTGNNPIHDDQTLDRDRVGLQGNLKDDARLRMTDQVKTHLEALKLYDDKNYRGKYFAQVHDAINLAITNETAKAMKDRLSRKLGREVKESDLIRDYFPILTLTKYICLCEATANILAKQQINPLDAIKLAADLTLPANFLPTPIDFTEPIGGVQKRLEESKSPVKQLSLGLD